MLFPKLTKSEIVWQNVFYLILYHIIALQGIYYCLTLQPKWQTYIWAYASGHGITAGVHRLWSHRSYKAKLPLKILLCFLQTVSFQNSVIEWSRDHRVHHKFTDTDADPHNSTRGFFFSHMGWLMVRKHPDVIKKGKTVDMSDLESDPVLRFQHKYYVILAPVMCFVVPTVIPWYFWHEDWFVAFCIPGMLRYLVTLHFTWLVNSAAHMWGMKPYDKSIRACNNSVVSQLGQGEGWHNYHHVFPWDYKAAELDSYNGNVTLAFIDLMSKIGWAYDLKTVSKEMIQKRIKELETK